MVKVQSQSKSVMEEMDRLRIRVVTIEKKNIEFSQQVGDQFTKSQV